MFFQRIGCDCLDTDDDTVCAPTDCDDTDPQIYPGAGELCNGVDDDCDGLIDEGLMAEDTDGDGVHELCDNCPLMVNPTQLDSDGDGRGNSCDSCVFIANPDQDDADNDARGDVCDNCPADFNPFQDDFDADAIGDACDNCAFDHNPQQGDMDDDYEGDLCDLNDGLILVRFFYPDYVEWQQEAGFDAWNNYRGDLAVLRVSGVYTQAPGSNPMAARRCSLADPWAEDLFTPSPGAAAFYLTTGVVNGVESGLGQNSAGVARPNTNPCP